MLISSTSDQLWWKNIIQVETFIFSPCRAQRYDVCWRTLAFSYLSLCVSFSQCWVWKRDWSKIYLKSYHRYIVGTEQKRWSAIFQKNFSLVDHNFWWLHFQNILSITGSLQQIPGGFIYMDTDLPNVFSTGLVNSWSWWRRCWYSS